MRNPNELRSNNIFQQIRRQGSIEYSRVQIINMKIFPAV